MDGQILGLGACFSFMLMLVATGIALLARARASSALKAAQQAHLRLDVLSKRLADLAARTPTSSPAAPTELPPVQVEPQVEPSAVSTPTAPEQPGPEGAATEPPPPPPPVVAVATRKSVEWEKWVGVKGAAVLGAAVFALAGLYLFKYSVAQGWISPPVRVAMAVVAGLAALVGGQSLRHRYSITAHALSGGGIVVLYSATWAAQVLYRLIPLPLAFVLMVLVTVVAAVLAVRQDNRLAAYLGLLGGFATPVLLSTGRNAPIGLFGYVFLLDAALLAVAYARRWKSIAALALGGTVLLQFAWIFTKMEPGQLPIAFTVLGLFAALFALFAARFSAVAGSSTASRVLQACALLTPLAALLFFAARTRLEVPLVPTAAMVTALLWGVGFVHRRSPSGEQTLLLLASFGSAAVVLVAAVSRTPTEAASWQLVALALLPAAATAFTVQRSPSDGHRRQALTAGLWLQGLMLLALVLAGQRAAQEPSHLALVAGLALSAALLFRSCAQLGQPVSEAVAGVGVALALAADCLTVSADTLRVPHAYSEAWMALGPSAVVAVALLGVALARRSAHALSSFVTTSLAWTLLLTAHAPPQPVQFLLGAALLVVVGTVGGLVGRHRGAVLAQLAVFGLRLAVPFRGEPGDVLPATALLLVAAATALVLHLLLMGAGPRYHGPPLGPFTLAFALVGLAPGLLLLWRQSLGVEEQGLLAILAAAVAMASAWAGRKGLVDIGSRGVMWLLASGAGFIAAAVPLQLEREWITISWAAMAVLHLWLWRRFDSRGLKWLALALLAAVTVRLLLNPSVLRYHLATGVPVLNWLTYTYLIPAACLGVASWLLVPMEVKRARGWELGLYRNKVPWGASLTSLAAALVVFAWVTLSVLDFFSPRTALDYSWERLPARDLALSLCWIAYAGSLLAVGMWRSSRAMRWMSLVFLLLSTAKVFLYDLGELKDLYRVASLAGLAISLLAISLAYQRFVFRGSNARREPA